MHYTFLIVFWLYYFEVSYFNRNSHAAIDDTKTAIGAATDTNNYFNHFDTYSHAAIDDKITSIGTAIDIDNSLVTSRDTAMQQ